MGEPARKPDIRELVGVAVNTSALTLKVGHEGATLRIAAVGAAALAISTGADRDDVPVSGSRPAVYGKALDQRDVIAGELAPMLWHIRYGGQHGLVPKAIALYARWLQQRRSFEGLTDDKGRALLQLFAGRVLHEWLSDRCLACGGSGKLERTRSGSWIRPRGSMQRNATFRACTTCNGSRRAAISHTARVQWLGMTMSVYESERWAQRFTAALVWLNQFHANRLVRPLTAELERRKRRG